MKDKNYIDFFKIEIHFSKITQHSTTFNKYITIFARINV